MCKKSVKNASDLRVSTSYSVAVAMIFMSVCAVAIIVLSLGFGAAHLSISKVIAIIKSGILGRKTTLQFTPSEAAIVLKIRLPRILSAFLVGAGLSVSGCIFQSLLRNPLADPYTLGVSTGAAFGASLAIYLNIAYSKALSTEMLAFTGAFLALIAVTAIAQKSGGIYGSSLIIGGIIVSSTLSSGISALKMLAGENVSAIVFWLMGSFSAANMADVKLLFPIVAVCSVLAWIYADSLDVMTLGEVSALGLGVNTKRVRILYLLLASAITASCVAVSGIIGFVGLIVPHILRFGLHGGNRILIPFSAVFGGIILLLADDATRIFSAGEIPVGVITTLLGGPFFLYVFLSRGKKASGYD